MKFPKFINNGGGRSSSRSASAWSINKSKEQLTQLTLKDDCNFQPQKPKNFVSNTPIGKTASQSGSTAFMSALKGILINEVGANKSTDLTPKREPQFNLVQIRQTTMSGSFLDASLQSQNNSSIRYVKSAQTTTKRLQRNRMQHVRSKPANYILKSTLTQNAKQSERQANRNSVSNDDEDEIEDGISEFTFGKPIEASKSPSCLSPSISNVYTVTPIRCAGGKLITVDNKLFFRPMFDSVSDDTTDQTNMVTFFPLLFSIVLFILFDSPYDVRYRLSLSQSLIVICIDQFTILFFYFTLLACSNEQLNCHFGMHERATPDALLK
jgi:hypothetical protein